MEEKKRAINWYPGHMTKARRMMEEDIKLVDLVIEIVDARIPLSSRNPDIDKLAKNKARIVLLNKSDLADDTVTDEWITYFKDKGFYCLKLNSRLNVSNRAVNNLITAACSAKIERDRARGIKNRSIKAMIVGIPNVGKSTFINSFTGRKSAKTGNKPGVTKGKQWIRINGSVELLDTPGILWPKIEDRNVGERLAMIGSINDQILNIEELALETIKFLKKNYQPQLYSRYDITEDIFDNVDTETMMNPENAAALCIMEHIARKRGCIKKGSDIDYEKCAACILDDFREGKITESFGEITPNTKGLTSFGNLRNCLPEPVSEAISEGMEYFDTKIKGFNREDTILCGIEARTSSPLRIERDQGFESNIKGIYPCGEGAGFAGGITSAAMDGIKVAQALVTV